MTPADDDRERLWSLIKSTRFALFTTRHADGHLHTRPMTTQNRSLDADDALWFFMSRGSEPVADLAREPEVNLGYADTDKDVYVSVAGRAKVVEDPARKRALWSTASQAWFPGGPEDADLALVRVTIAHAEYWQVDESKPVQLFKMARAALTGRPPQMGRHGEIGRAH